jgi:pyruvate dehydrogenase E1 component beta subunit
VVLLEAGRLASRSEAVDLDSMIELGTSRIARKGGDVTIVALGFMVGVALDAASMLERVGVDTEVIDLRSVVPLDVDAIRGSVEQTGRLVVVDESMPTCSVASEVITAVVENHSSMSALQAAPVRVCTAPVPVPFSPILEDEVLPGVQDIYDAALASVRERTS